MDCDESLSEDETIQDIPPILCPELRDVFPIFVNMLDIKSFIKLAMTSKDMYQECMGNKFIKIDVEEDTVTASAEEEDDSIDFDFASSVVPCWHPHKKSYLVALNRPQFSVNLSSVRIYAENEIDVISATRRYIEEKRVNRIKELALLDNSTDWEALISLLKDFKVQLFYVRLSTIPLHILHSILQLNLEVFYYDQPVEAGLILETNSPIHNIRLGVRRRFSGDEFMQLLSKIQSGSLIGVTVCKYSVDLRPYKELPFDHEGALPEERPLFIRRREHIADDSWLLHRDGAVTALRYEAGFYIKFCKCEPIDYPWMLREEKDVLKDLNERRPKAFCSAKQFQTFLGSLKTVDSSHEGPLPKERPLYCKVSKTHFWWLDEDDSLTKCTWVNGCAVWEPFNISDNPERFRHPTLAKYMFWKLLRNNADVPFNLYCANKEELNSWFEDFKKLGFEYSGPLSPERPVVFEGMVDDGGRSKNIFVILFEEHVLSCEIVGKEVVVKKCEAKNRPAILMTADVIRELLQDSLSRARRFKDMDRVYVDKKTFLDGFELFKTSPIEVDGAGKEPNVYEKTTRNKDGEMIEECWYGVNRRIAKATWEKGRLHFPYCYLNELPFEFVKKCFIPLAQMGYPDGFVKDNLLLDLEQFSSCLEQFTVVPFDYSGPLASDSPLAFVKNESRHTCDGTPNCGCLDHFIRVYFMWKDMTTTYCSWAENTPRYVDFRGSSVSSKDVPLAMKSKEYLEAILEKMLNTDGEYQWFGQFDDLTGCLKEYKTLPFDYDGPLPEERPLVFEDEGGKLSRFILRDDGKFVEGKWHSDRVWFQLRYDRC